MSDRSKKAPLKRHFISLELKVEILNRLKVGEKVTCVAKTLNLNEATIRTIQKNEQKIRMSVAASCSVSANMTSRSRAPIIEKMEKALNSWIDDNSRNQIPVGTNVIKHKALEIYNHLKESGESPIHSDFVASKGWFDRFKKRFSLQNTKIKGDNETYSKKPQKIVGYSGYVTQQVSNADETDLWWKNTPQQTLISRNEKLNDTLTCKNEMCIEETNVEDPILNIKSETLDSPAADIEDDKLNIVHSCDICKQRYRNEDDLQAHKIIHIQQHQFYMQNVIPRNNPEDELKPHDFNRKGFKTRLRLTAKRKSRRKLFKKRRRKETQNINTSSEATSSESCSSMSSNSSINIYNKIRYQPNQRLVEQVRSNNIEDASKTNVYRKLRGKPAAQVQKDAFYWFGKYVASQLRQMPLEIAMQAQNAVQSILTAKSAKTK